MQAIEKMSTFSSFLMSTRVGRIVKGEERDQSFTGGFCGSFQPLPDWRFILFPLGCSPVQKRQLLRMRDLKSGGSVSQG